MPTHVPVPSVSDGDVFTTADWNDYIEANINKLLNQQHRVLSVAAFTALTSPEDGDEVYLEVDGTNGIMWHLRYVSTESTYYWRYLGGPAMVSEVTTAETTASTTYAALSTAGPSIALPRAGDYDVQITARLYGTSGTSQPTMSYDIGGTGAVDADQILSAISVLNVGGEQQRKRRKTALTTETLTGKYKVSGGGGGTMGAANRTMTVTPVRIRHDA